MPDQPPERNGESARARGAVAAVAGAIDHPVRVGIVNELAGVSSGRPASFTGLRDAVGLRDNGRFNYHLDQLLGHLVERDDAGYRLTTTGEEVARLLRTGHLADPERHRELPAGTPCHTCGESLVLACQPRRVTVRCPGCAWDRTWQLRVPRRVFDAEPATARRVLDRVLRNASRALADGLCPGCLAETTGRLTASTGADSSLAVAVTQDCDRCDAAFSTTPGHLALTHDATAGFFDDHGIRLADRATWDLEFVVTDHQTRVRSRDPWRVDVRPQIGNDELVLTVDETAAVVASRRHTKFTARSVWYPNRVRS